MIIRFGKLACFNLAKTIITLILFWLTASYVSAKSSDYFVDNAITDKDRLINTNYIANILCGNSIINYLVERNAYYSKGFVEDGIHYSKYYNDHASIYWSKEWKRQPDAPRGSWLVREVTIKDLNEFYQTRKFMNATLEELEQMFGFLKPEQNSNIYYTYGDSAIVKFIVRGKILKEINVNCRGSAF